MIVKQTLGQHLSLVSPCCPWTALQFLQVCLYCPKSFMQNGMQKHHPKPKIHSKIEYHHCFAEVSYSTSVIWVCLQERHSHWTGFLSKLGLTIPPPPPPPELTTTTLFCGAGACITGCIPGYNIPGYYIMGCYCIIFKYYK